MTRCSVFLLIILSVVSWQTVFAQYRFDSWTTDNGLPQNGLRGIVQTPDGYLWFTTFDGLVRFDGVQFTTFDKGNTKGIINNRFSNLYAEKDGTLWAATEDGELTVYRDGVFTSYGVDQGPPGRAKSFLPGENGEMRMVTDAGYYRFQDGEFVFFAPRAVLDPQKKIYVAPSGTRWTITRNRIHQLKDDIETVYQFTPKNFDKISVDAPWDIYEDHEGGLWIGELGGVYRFHGGTVTRVGQKDGLPSDTYPHIYWEEADGSVWFTTGDQNLAGVGLFQIRNGRVKRYGPEVGLSNDRIMNVFKDREGTVWLATNKGLNRLRRQIMTAYSIKDGLIHNEVYPILQGRHDEILIGTAAGLSRYRNGRFINEGLRERIDQFENVQALYEDQGGRLFIGSIGGSFTYENGKKGNFTNDGTVAAIIEDRGGRLWLGKSTGLCRFNDGRATTCYTTREGLAGDDVKVIHESVDGALWIGTYGGLSVFKDGRFVNYTTKDGLASDRVRSIYEDPDGTFWIGTYDGGLSRLKDGKFFNFTVDNGLFNNGVFATLEDDHGNLWISCNKGIYRVSKQQLNNFADGRINGYESFSYGKEEGMLNTECNGGRQPSALKDKNGKLWFPTLEGVVIVDPDLVMTNPFPPPVEIETVAIDRQALTNEFLQSAIRNPKSQIEVGSSQTSLDITYTGLSLIKSDQIRFKYKLEGLDTDWVDAGTRRTVNYSYLPPGDYTFTVTAANSDGVWNTEGKSIKIFVIAPIYRAWWFIILVALSIAGAAWLIYRYRVARLKEVHEAQEAFSQKLLESQEHFARQLIESQEQERKRIAAEIHDSLGQNLLVIKNRALLGLGVTDKDKAKTQFTEIQESAAEALSEVRSIAYNLRPLHLERLGLTSTLEEMCEQVEAASGIKIMCDIAPIDDFFTGEGEINFYRIVQECLNNIVKHSRAKKASVTVYTEDRNVFLSVKDNGRGFDPNDLNGNQSGLGLNGIAERVKILNGTYSIESVKRKGTTVLVCIEGEKGRRGERE